jgi:DNA-binding transcriptional MerR regulator
MKKAMFSREKLLAQAGISMDELQEWERIKLVKPDGVTEDKSLFYTKETLDKIRHIKRLLEVGYQLDHILKIIKKVGLPRGQEKKDKPAKLHEYLTVGGLAQRVGISPRAVKHWEDKGIIEPDMRSEGGFRLYSETYVFLCQLIKDLQLFGYSLEEIKSISSQFRNFLAISSDMSTYSADETVQKLDDMTTKINHLQDKMDLLKVGVERWENLLKKKKKEIVGLKSLNLKRQVKKAQKNDA